MLDPNEAVGFPRGLRKTERETAEDLGRAQNTTPELEPKVEQDAKNQRGFAT